MSKKILSAGHICLDITPTFTDERTFNKLGDILAPGKLINSIGAADIHTGGSVANTGLALKILGADVSLLCKVGDDAFGKLVMNIMDEYDAHGVIVDKNSATSYSVVIAIPGLDRMFLHCPGANDTFVNSDISDEALKDAAMMHFGYPTLMKCMYENDGAELVKLFKRMKEHSIATSMDMSAIEPNSPAGKANWEKILTDVLPYTDFFLPSAEELCFMLNRKRYDELCQMDGDMAANMDIEKDIVPMAEKLISLGCKVVLIKCGTKGMYLATADKDALLGVGANLGLDASLWANKGKLQHCFRAEKVVSATGAGDTSIAAFLAAVLNGEEPYDCLALAAAEGACAVTSYDALSGLKPLDELKKKISSGWETF